MRKFKIIVVTILCLITNVVIGQDTIQQRINSFISQAKFDDAVSYIQSNLENVGQKTDRSALNYQLVKVFFMQSRYNEALLQAFNSLDTIDDEHQRVKFNFMIGCIYSAISDYDKSIEYFDLVVEHNQDATLAVQTHLLLSQLHSELGDTENAGKSITEAYKITSLSKLENKVNSHVAMQYNFYSKNYELCKQLNFETIKDTTSFLNAKSYAYSMIGDCLIEQDSLMKATSYYDEFLKLTVETKDPEQIKVAASKLIEVYEKLDNQEKANVYHRIYNEAVSDSLSFSIEKYRDLYDVEKNRELEIVKSKSFKKYLLYGSVLLLLISLGIYYYFRRKNIQLATLNTLVRKPGKKMVISDTEINKITGAIDKLVTKELFLTPNITRKSFCAESDIKSERYLSQFINEKYNKSFSIFVNDLRIEYAHKRIQNDSKFRSYKIEEIAKASGFGSKKSFERSFVTKYNETPYKLISRITA